MKKMLYNKRYNNLGGMAMNCMKCGRETQDDSAFCQNCLTEMAKHPVLPETVVLLPRRRESSVIKKTTKRHTPTLEEQNAELREWNRILLVIVVICIAAIAFMFKPTMHYVMDEHVEIGQNYSSVSATTADSVN